MARLRITPTLRIPGLIDVVEKNGRPYYLIQHKGEPEVINEFQISEDEICRPPKMLPWPLPSHEVVDHLDDDDMGVFLDLGEFIWDHLEMPHPGDYSILALWAMMTWLYDDFSCLPFLFFHGPHETGKTQALLTLREVCYRSMTTVIGTEAALFRSAKFWGPTYFVDEATLWDRDKKANLIGLLNARHKRGLYVPRVDVDRKGENSLEVFDPFGPTAFFGTEDMTSTLRSRCITFPMLENIRPIQRKIDEERGRDLRTRLLAFGMRYDGDVPGSSGLEFLRSGRRQELFEPLLSMARILSNNNMSNSNEQLNLNKAATETTQFPQFVTEHIRNRGNAVDSVANPSFIEELVKSYAADYERREIGRYGQMKEAAVLRALVDSLPEAEDLDGRKAIRITDVTGVFNEGLPKSDKKRVNTVGRWLSNLHFKKDVLPDRRRAVIWDEDLARKHGMRYDVKIPLEDDLVIRDSDTVYDVMRMIRGLLLSDSTTAEDLLGHFKEEDQDRVGNIVNKMVEDGELIVDDEEMLRIQSKPQRGI